MNSLSLMIYMVGLAEKLTSYLPGTFALCAILVGVGTILYIILSAAGFDWNGKEEPAVKIIKPMIMKVVWIAAIVGGLTGIVNVIMPTKQTMILIAASEVSETILTSEQAQKTFSEVGGVGSDALQLLKSYIAKEQAEIAKELAATVKENVAP